MNKFERGITIEEEGKLVPMQTGVSPHGGIPQISEEDIAAQERFTGIPMPGPGMSQRPSLPVCESLTKKGNPCKAHPIHGSRLCVGHLKASG